MRGEISPVSKNAFVSRSVHTLLHPLRALAISRSRTLPVVARSPSPPFLTPSLSLFRIHILQICAHAPSSLATQTQANTRIQTHTLNTKAGLFGSLINVRCDIRCVCICTGRCQINEHPLLAVQSIVGGPRPTYSLAPLLPRRICSDALSACPVKFSLDSTFDCWRSLGGRTTE